MVISKKKRFSIFERDMFTCQYCGKKPPDVVLEVDHIISKKDGGLDDDINLTTSCFACNRGKSSKSVDLEKIKKTTFKQELKFLEDKKTQLEAYYNFIKQKNKFKDSELDVYQKCWNDCSNDKYSLSDTGLKAFKKLLNKYTSEQIFKAIKISWDNHKVIVNDKYKYMCGVLKNMKLKEDSPLQVQSMEDFYRYWNKYMKTFINKDTVDMLRSLFSKGWEFVHIKKHLEKVRYSEEGVGYSYYENTFVDLVLSDNKLYSQNNE